MYNHSVSVTNSHSHPFPLPDGQQQAENETSATHDDMNERNSFCLKTLRLSRSFPSSTGHGRRPSSSLSITRWKESLAWTNSNFTSPEEDPHSQLHFPTPSERANSIFSRPHRLRTRSLDRKPSNIFSLAPTHQVSPIKRKGSSPDNRFASSISSNESGQRYLAGFHSHIPIERTVLSVLPSNRRPSINWTTPVPSGMHESSGSCPSATSSGSPDSTLATSVDSSGTPPRPRYQPRPLLLSAFGANSKRTGPDPSNRPSRSSQMMGDQEIIISKSRRTAEIQREKMRQDRQERLHAREAKKLRKRAREAELGALSSCVRPERRSAATATESIPEADEDDWSWLSCSDADDQDESAEEDAEEMAVVWRASLDVGRRVSKDRKALGRGHGIRLNRNSKPASTISRPTPSQRSSLIPTSVLAVFSPLKFVQMLFQKQRAFLLTLPSQPTSPFLFGSGMLSGLICSLLCSTLSAKIPSAITSRLLPLSSSGIGIFLSISFPNTPSALGGIATSLGLSAHWCMSLLIFLP
ncbi:hypothetical protein PCASD_04454 [Puccinia coronata f. sp. avenae]|uniref:Uncharacterized protein n=1 Tax=Puccinia coronata f. sp. avenae TaxID=200324 RepID=A0A2N5RV58_9BASI|nr:hypothetical protein PCASD_26309 [Puccinia coronata f. sp. avenae]PLW44404.1 hypothetical protein PCASD_04454 [Puccinia coronata f. sp. avenae]